MRCACHSQKVPQAHSQECPALLTPPAAGCRCLLLPCLCHLDRGWPEAEEAAAQLLQAQAGRHRCLVAAHLGVGLGRMCPAQAHAKAGPHVHAPMACSTGAKEVCDVDAFHACKYL